MGVPCCLWLVSRRVCPALRGADASGRSAGRRGAAKATSAGTATPGAGDRIPETRAHGRVARGPGAGNPASPSAVPCEQEHPTVARIAFILTTCHEFEGVKVLSSVLKLHGHACDVFITSEEPDYYQAVLDWQPDVVGIYATSGQEAWGYHHIQRWKQALPHLKVVMGGPHPSHDLEPLYEREIVDATIKA